MTPLAVHIVRKDLREHAAWIVPYLAVVVVRALLIGSGVDRLVTDRLEFASLGFAYIALMVTHAGLLVVLTVQVVQADRLVGTTAFWVTRPVCRWHLLAAKLIVLAGVLVVIPVAVDALVVAGNGLPLAQAAGAAADGALLRLAVVLPIAVLASVSADLAGFVVPAVCVLLGVFATEAAIARLGLVAKSSRAANDSIFVFTAVVVVAGALATFAHQVLTRRTARSTLIALLTVVVALLVANRWTAVVVGPPRGLEAGWLDPAKVHLAVSGATPAETRTGTSGWAADRAGWIVAARYDLDGAPPSVVLAPNAATLRSVFPDGSRQAAVVRARLSPFAAAVTDSSPDQVETLGRLLGTPIASSQHASVEHQMPVAVVSEEGRRTLSRLGAQADVEATIGAVAYRIGAVLPLQQRSRGTAGDHSLSLLSAACRDARCAVVVREVRTDFLVDLRRPSGLQYVLVNRLRKVALRLGDSGYRSREVVLGAISFATLGEHINVARRTMVFGATGDQSLPIDASWEKDAELVAVEVRDLGEFALRTTAHLPGGGGN
jgi:hypothetical protein